MASPTPQTERPRSERATRTRQRILDAAGQCFAGVGFAKTTVEEIAGRAGVSKALVYRHFRSKEQILEAVLEATLAAWAEASGEQALLGDGPVLEAIAEMHRAAAAFARTSPVLRALMTMDESVLLTVGEAAVRREMERFQRALLHAVERGMASGELRADVDASRVCDVIRMLHMSVIENLLDPRWIGAPDDGTVEASLEILFRGIAAGGRS